ncbi:putative glyoxalase superfamily protein PhnB [Pedobacter sp. UYP24]
MRSQINAVTIAAKDLLKLKDFYSNSFGWEIHSENTEIVMFRLKHGLIFSIYKQQDHALYIGNPNVAGEAFPKYYLTINTNSLKETDELFMELEIKSVNIVKKPEKVFWGGYSGIITDPEGNYWEIGFNPME